VSSSLIIVTNFSKKIFFQVDKKIKKLVQECEEEEVAHKEKMALQTRIYEVAWPRPLFCSAF